MQEKKIEIADQMREHITAWELSGMCVKQYCTAHGLKRSSFYYWQKKISATSTINSGSFIQLQPVAQNSAVEVIFTNGVRIHFNNLVPADYIKQLIG